MERHTRPDGPARARELGKGGGVFRDIARRQWDERHRRRPHAGRFVRGLRLLQTLEKHGGCVNSVAWNEVGPGGIRMPKDEAMSTNKCYAPHVTGCRINQETRV
jgi:hypothetical protein